MKTFKILYESIVDEPRKTYAKNVFDRANTENPRVKKGVKDAILRGMKKFEDIAPILRYRLIGGILTKQYNEDSDMDVNVLFDVPSGNRAKIHEKLLPTGRGFVLDREAKKPLGRREASHRRQISPETVKQEMKEAGFTLRSVGPRLAADRFLLVFGKSE